MSWAAFLPENIRQHPAHFVGPNVAGIIVQCLESGILINQSVRFWSRAESEPRVTKLLVVFVSCVASFQTLIAIYNTWRVVVLGFGNVTNVVVLGWADRIQPALNCVMAAPFQAFLIWRCWNVMQRRWIILAPLVTLLLATVIMNVYITFDVFYSFRTAVLAVYTELQAGGPPHSYITAYVLTAVLDILITALMMWFLLRVKSQVISRRFAKTLTRLHRMIWEAAIPPCACAIAACCVYITMSQKNLWDLFCQSILGKLYVISLFVILNGRADLKRTPPAPTRTTDMSRYWATDALVRFRVDLTSVIDRQADSNVEITPTTENLRASTDVRGNKSDISACDRGEVDAGRHVSISVHDRSFFEMRDAAEASSLVTRPPTVLHRLSSFLGIDRDMIKVETPRENDDRHLDINSGYRLWQYKLRTCFAFNAWSTTVSISIFPGHPLSSCPAMSRRDSSRVHIAVRQNDTLAEFENFKKKFLFANKQITKQNCSLSLKIEELNAHISTLYVENLRLRASEIALQSQLKREKVKNHKIMADAEAATVNLLKHFGIIRQSYNVPTERPPSPKDTDSPPSARCQKPPPRSPSAMRLAALPTVPDINEDPEPHETSSEENEFHLAPRRLTSMISSRRRTSISRLPVPSRVSSPPPTSTAPSMEEGTSRKRKLTRRASGLMSPTEPVPRPLSPALGSPMQQDIDLSAEEEAAALQDVEDMAAREEEREREMALKKPRKKSKTRDESDLEVIERRERRKAKDRDVASAVRLKDVTNSPRRRRAAPATDSISEMDHERQGLPNAGRPSLTISPPLRLSSKEDMAYLPTPLPSSAGNTPVAQHFALPSSDAEANVGSRERRTRKSVNYAEPKLNTKMRKPDSIAPPGARPSLPMITPATTPTPFSSSTQSRSTAGSSPEAEESEAPSSISKSITGRRSTSSLVPSAKRKRLARTLSEDGVATDDHDEDETDGGEADAEFSDFRGWANVNARRKSVQSSNTHDVVVIATSRKMSREIEDSFGRRHSMAV